MIDINLLQKLNQAVELTGEPLEGNLFYSHHHVPESYELFKPFAVKRQFLIDLAKKFAHIVEIGFNAGHSAALLLSSNDQLQLTSVDIGSHLYVIPCAKVITKFFPGRHNLILKDSAQLSQVELQDAEAVIIDGNHLFEPCAKDLELCLLYCKPGTVIVLDDFDMPGVKQALETVRTRLELYEELSYDKILQGVFYIV